ncbi:MAG TPA: hypothetical protein VK508_07360 [Cyclobacteriaceae bacterium]|nr:hypothetical protein [Cyclobacteriaceae bacterium]
MEVKVEVTDSANGKQGSVKVTTTDTTLKFSLHLIAKGTKDKNSQLDIMTGTIEDIPPGRYDLLINAPDGYCSEARKVTVN